MTAPIKPVIYDWMIDKTSVTLSIFGDERAVWFTLAFVASIILCSILLGLWIAVIAYWRMRNKSWRKYVSADKKRLQKKIQSLEYDNTKLDAERLRLASQKQNAEHNERQASLLMKSANAAASTAIKNAETQIRNAQNDAKSEILASKRAADAIFAQLKKDLEASLGRESKLVQELQVLRQSANEKIAKEKDVPSQTAQDAYSSYPTPSPHPLNWVAGHDAQGNKVEVSCEPRGNYLFAGVKGSGKSNGLNNMLVQLMRNNAPKSGRVKFAMIDMKDGAELFMYENSPHLVRPIAITLEGAADLLRWVSDERSRRQTELKSMGIKKLDDCLAAGRIMPFPFMMVVIDEIAELMIRGDSSERKELKTEDGELILSRKELKAECRELIRSLASLGRAAGVYLAVATQYPTAEVIASNIKLNLDVRFAYMVVTGVESRVILDANGAERLQRPGECIFKHNRYLMNLTTPKIEDSEIRAVVGEAIKISENTRNNVVEMPSRARVAAVA